jgi:cell wall-associated NlpC family hydrolase
VTPLKTGCLRRNAVKLPIVLAALVLLAVVLGSFTQRPARADQLANMRARAAAIAAKIAALGQREDALSQRYDYGVEQLDMANKQVEAATRAFETAKAHEAATLALLQQDALQAYVGGGPAAALGAPASLKSLDQALLRNELEATFAADQTSALDSYQLAAANASTARAALLGARNAEERRVAGLERDRELVQAAQAKLVALEEQVNGQIATVVAQLRQQQLLAEQRAEAELLARERAQQQAAAAAAAAAEARRQAAIQAALRAATTTTAVPAPAAATTSAHPALAVSSTTVAPAVTTTTGAPAVAAQPAPGPSQAATIAVQAALSRVGDPYVWGAAGPDAFDCSGLVMWAYAQAGIYLPHYSGSQYADTTHIPMSDLEPGDLVFPADPGEHVAMYIGNGEIVQAPYTGADVQVVPLTSFYVLASRVG